MAKKETEEEERGALLRSEKAIMVYVTSLLEPDEWYECQGLHDRSHDLGLFGMRRGKEIPGILRHLGFFKDWKGYDERSVRGEVLGTSRMQGCVVPLAKLTALDLVHYVEAELDWPMGKPTPKDATPGYKSRAPFAVPVFLSELRRRLDEQTANKKHHVGADIGVSFGTDGADVVEQLAEYKFKSDRAASDALADLLAQRAEEGLRDLEKEAAKWGGGYMPVDEEPDE